MLPRRTEPMRNHAMPGGHPASRPTLPTQLWVDKPTNTTLRSEASMINGSLQGGSPAGPAPDILSGLQNVAKYLGPGQRRVSVPIDGVMLMAFPPLNRVE